MIICPDEEIWFYSLQLAMRLREKGSPIPIADLIIASTAIVCHFTLISDDHHFQTVQSVDVALKVKPLDNFSLD